MDMMEYQVIMGRIREIEQEQLSWLDYVCEKIDVMINEQKDTVQRRMLQLWDEKMKLREYKNKSMVYILY